MDGHDLTFEQEFDAVFSNAALHWMSRNPVSVVSGVRRALKPGGKFVGGFGGHGAIAAIRTALAAVFQKRGMNPETSLPWYNFNLMNVPMPKLCQQKTIIFATILSTFC